MKVTDNNNKPNNKADEGEKLIKKSADHELLLEGRVDLGAEPIAVAMVEQLDLMLSENQSVVIADDIDVKNNKRKDKKEQLEQDNQEQTVKDSQSDIEQSNTAGEGAVEADPISEAEGEGEVAKALAEKQAAKGFGVYLSELSMQTLVLGSLGFLGAATYFRNKDDFETPIIVSSETAQIIENSGSDQVVYRVELSEGQDSLDGINYSLVAGSDSALTINATTGVVSLSVDPLYYNQQSYSFSVIASDANGNVSEPKAVVLTVIETLPQQAEVTLTEDAGIADDGISNNNEITVTGIKLGAKWEYSTDNGANWLIGSESADNETATFLLAEDGDYQILVRQTNTAGTVQTNTALAVTIETAAPELVAINSSVDNATITLTFNELLNNAIPSATDFKITQDTDLVAISNISINGKSVILTVEGLTNSALQILYTPSANPIQDVAGNSATSFAQMVVSDGYIRGAEVYVDTNNNGIADESELIQGLTSDALGQIVISGDYGDGQIIVKGGVNVDTGAINQFELTAPAGYTVINPLSTLIREIVASDESQTVQQAEDVLNESLGITLGEGEDLSNYDPISDVSENAIANRVVTAQIATVLAVAAAVDNADDSGESKVEEAALDNLVAIVTSSDGELSLDEASVSKILSDDSGSSLVSNEDLAVVTTAVKAMEEIKESDAVNLETAIAEIIKVQAEAIDEISPAAPDLQLTTGSNSGVSDNDGVTNIPNPSVKVSFDTIDIKGRAVVAGDAVVFLNDDKYIALADGDTIDLKNDEQVNGYILQQSDIDTGFYIAQLPSLPDSDITAIIIDIAGNPSESSVLVTIDTTLPVIISADTAENLNENSQPQVIYTAAIDTDDLWKFELSQDSDPALTIDVNTGEVSLNVSPDHELQSQYNFTVIATDAAGNASNPKSVILDINDLDDAVPTITSAGTAASIDENSGASQVVYTATADDSGDDIVDEPITFTLSKDSDSALTIDSVTGVVILNTDPDHEAQSEYSFAVIATDAAGNASDPKSVTLAINNVDDTAPIIISVTPARVDENIVPGQKVYTVIADDSFDTSDGVFFSLSPDSDPALMIDSVTGEVTLDTETDFETQSQYSFTVTAVDAAGNQSAEQSVTLDINNLDEVPPLFKSSNVADVVEGNESGDVVYTAVTEDRADISSGIIEYSLVQGDLLDPAFEINQATGEVTLNEVADYEAKASYTFTVIASDTINKGVTKQVTLNVINIDDTAPIITSEATASIDENSGAGLVVYQAIADDSADVSEGVLFSLLNENLGFTINSETGVVTTNSDFAADFEARGGQSQSFTVVATDVAGNLSTKQITVSINDIDESAPVITSGNTAASINENTGSRQVVYSATSNEEDVLFSLSEETDATLFAINSTSGAVTFKRNPDYEDRNSFSFEVIATDAVGNVSETQPVTLSINNVDDRAPEFTSSTVGNAIDENAETGVVVYDANAVDTDFAGDEVITFSLADEGLGFSIDANGIVTTNGDFVGDYQEAQSQSFTVVATDGAGNVTEQVVTVAINEIDEVAPTITSADTTVAIDENSGAGQVVYTATASDTDFNGLEDITFSLADDSLGFSIDADTGVVTTNADFESNFEDAQSQSFTVVATDAAGNASDQVVSVAINNLDEVAPVINSGDTATAIDENSGEGQVVYTATASDTDFNGAEDITFSLADESVGFSIDADTGVVTTNGDFAADYEDAQSQSFTVVATDVAGNASEQVVSVAINNLDEVAPTITSGDSAAVLESSDADTVVYRALVDDTADISEGVTFTLSEGHDPALSIDEVTGEVTLADEPDFATKPSYSFTVIADDGVNESQKAVTLSVVDEDLEAPVFTSSAAVAIDENIGENQVIYTAVTEDESLVTYSLSDDDTDLSVNSDTGAVTLTTDPDHESQSEYSFTVIATDAAGNASQQVVNVSINNLDEIAPTITSADSAGSINENTGAGTVIYTATATDDADISAGVTFSLKGDSDPALSIDSLTGAVTLSADADYEAQSDYTFTVIASDGVNDDVEQSVFLDVNNLDEVAPTITSDAADTTSVNENSGEGQVVYTATATDTDFNGLEDITFSLADDSLGFSIDADTGVVTTNADFAADYEDAQSQSFTVVATDATGNASTQQLVSVAINNLDEVAPVINSGDTAVAIDENSGAGQVIYTATADDSADISAGVTFRLVEDNNSSKFAINEWNGEVTLLTSPDYEETQSLSFTVVATDAAGNESQAQSVTLNINNLDEVPPTITSASAIAVQETYVDQDPDSQSQDLNIFVNEAIYQTTVDDSSDIPTSGATDITYALTDGSDPAINIDANTGEVTLDTSGLEFSYVNQQAYTFGIVATDAANNVSDAHTVTLSVEEAKPREAIVEVTYSGVDGQPTNNGEIQVSNIKPGSTWEYSTDGGANWESGTYDSDIDASAIGEGSFTIVGDSEYTVDVRVINAQDIATALTTPIVITVDTAPPAPQFVNADSESSVINVVYNESLDATYQPLSADYSITQQGSELTVSTVEFIDGEDADGNLIANSVLQLTISGDTPFAAGALSFTYTASDNASELVTDLAGNQVEQGFTQKIVSDGYIRDAEVYIINEKDELELRAEVTSDSFGQIILTDEFLSAPENTDENGNPYQIVIKGGVNVDSGARNEIELTAPAGYSVINPLSTLVQEIASSLEVEGASQAEKDAAKAEAEASLADSLGISLDEGSSLGSYDPQSDDNVANRVVATQIATVLAVASSTESAGAETAALASLADTITEAEGSVTLDSETLGDALEGLIDADSLETIGTAVNTMEAVKNSQDDADFDLDAAFEEIVLAQAKAIDNVAPKAPVPALATESNSGVSDSDNLTNDTSPEITINLDTTATDGTAVVAGDTVEIFSNDQSETYVLSAEDIENGSFSYNWQGELNDGVNYISAIAIDRNLNESEYVFTFEFEVDITELVISSGDTAESIDENSDDNQVIYTATVDGDDLWKFELTEGSDSALTIDSVTGEVTLSTNPNYEIQSQYSFAVTATDNAGNESAVNSVTLDINNLDEIAPTITSATIADTIDENSGAGQVIYTASADDSSDISAGVTFSLAGIDAAAFAINEDSGEVTLSTDPDYETQSEYSFTVIASDGVNDAVERAVTLDINNLDEVAPSITSGDTGSAVDENSGVGQVVYTATATDDADISAGFSFSLDDESLGFSIDADGVVTTNAGFAANYEDAQSQSFTVVATDAAGNASEQVVSVAINNLDEVAPSITSGDTATAIDENSGAGQVVYTATATDDADTSDGITLSLADDGFGFSIDADGVVTTNASFAANYEDAQSQSFTVVATDAAGNASEQVVNVAINNLDEIAPTITSGDTATAIDENSGADQVVYTATADDSLDISAGVIFSLSPESDPAISIDPSTGAVTLSADPDFEDQSEYSFAVVATDAADNVSEAQSVTLDINNLDEVAPSITSGDTATAIDENSGEGQVVYTATADDSLDTSDGFSFSLADDSLGFSIDAATGVVTTNADFAADYEDVQSQSFTVVATDVAGKASQQLVSVAINNLDEVAPSITSGDTATAIDENSGEGQVVYTATATDDADTSDGFSFSLADESLGFSVDADTGVVTTNSDFEANFEDAQSQSFTVVATDVAGKASQQVLNVAINNLDEVAPSITSGDTATAIDENSGAGQVVYTATASDTDFNGLEDITFSLADDRLGFSIDAATGVVTTNADFAADYEDAQSQSFTVVAMDAVGNVSEQVVSVAINNLDEVAPSITSGDTATAVNENSGADQVVYSATASDTDFNGLEGITFSLADNSLGFSIDADGVVTTNADFAANYENAQSQSFTLVATDVAGNASQQVVNVAINNLDEVAPSITSGDTATAIDESSGAGQVVYTATADDSADVVDTPATDNSSDTSSAVSTVNIPDLVEATQHVYVSSSTKSEDGTQETIVISYNAEDTTTPGLGIRVHYDSSAININGISDILSNDLLSASSDPIADDDNDDGDTNTDQFVTFAWASLFSSWPNSAPVDLATITFDIDEDAIGMSAINFTASSNAAGFDFDGQTHNLALTAAAEVQASPITFSLADESLGFSIDADGVVTTNADFAADYEDTESQSFIVVATDEALNFSDQLVSVAINNLDEVAPNITSGDTATAIDENTGAGQVVYTATADDSLDISAGVTFSLTGDSDPALSIDSSTGAVTLINNPDYETQPNYTFTVIASDGFNDDVEQSVTLTINDLVDPAPTITSGIIADDIDENSGAGQVIYEATAQNSAGTTEGLTFGLSPDSDTELLIDSSTGKVTLSTDPDHETQSSYSFSVVATDAAGNESEAQSVILEINDLDDAAPTITSGDTAVTIDENTGSDQIVYTATADDSADDVSDTPITFSLSSDSDVALSIDSATGEVTLFDDPDHEVQSSYNFAVIATDAAGNVSEAQSVTLDINNLDEVAPSIDSGDTATAVDENSGEGQVVYTATASDTDFNGLEDITFSLADESLGFSIDASTGVVTTNTDFESNFEDAQSQSFTVVATDGAGNASEKLVSVAINNLDEVAPSITSGDTAVAINENSGASQVIYTAIADDSLDTSDGVTFSLSFDSDPALSIDPSTGEVTLSADADYETQSVYSFTVVASDGVNGDVEQSVTLDINNLDEIAPSITSGDTAVAIDENTGAGQVVYTAIADDSLDISAGVTFSLSGIDAAAFTINEDSGEVTLIADADYEEQSQYSFTIVASDGVNGDVEQSVTLDINNLDEIAPSITSGDTAVAIDENTGADTVIYTATADDSLDISAGVTFSLTGDSDPALSIDPSTGEVTLSADADYETQSVYSFTVVASDGVNGDVEQSVTLDINNLDEVAPSITSGDTTVAIDENTGADTVIYTAIADDSLDISAGVTFSLSGIDAAAFTINEDSGEVTLIADADYEIQSQYSFTVVVSDGVNGDVEQSVTLDINNLDEIAPSITSGDTAVAIDENTGADTVIYTAIADDSLDISAGVIFSLTGDSDPALSIDPSTGEVTLSADADYETQSVYSFTVVVSDGVNGDVEQSVTLDINNLDEIAPSITSGDTAVAIDENTGAGQVVYTAIADDSLDISAGVTFSLTGDSDPALSIDPSTGEVTLSADADYETQSVYSFTVVASDGVNGDVEQSVTLDINNLDEVAPSITSGDTAVAIDENTGADTVIYTATAYDSADTSDGVTFSLSFDSDPALSIDPSTGEVTLSADADYEVQSVYSFTVVASDGVNGDVEQSVTLDINNLDEVAPSITSGDTAVAIDENTGADTVIYTATAYDSADTSDGVTFSLSFDSDPALSIDPSTGEVTLSADADYEVQSVYSFTVVASDGVNGDVEQSVTLDINNLDEVAPSITSGDTAVAIDENTGADTVIYTATADDSLDISAGVTFSLTDDSDTALSIDPSTGEVTLSADSDSDSDYETQSVYSFTVVASDGVNGDVEQSVTLDINNLDEIAPSITSGDTAVAINENTGADTVIYTAIADDSLDISAGVTFSLTGDSDPTLSIDPSTGAVTLSADADYETQSQYSFTVVASDGVNGDVEQSVTLDINNLDEIAPSITSGDTAVAINENTGADTVIYTAIADDSLDISAGVTFSLTGDSDPTLSIDPSTGAVTLSADADYETQSQYSFAVIATDAADNESDAQSVTLDINNLDEVAPIVTSGDTASAIDENSGAGQVVYTATASDTDFNGLEDITFSLADESLGFSIDADTGVVTTNTEFAADYEDAQSQSFTVVATDVAGNASQQLVSLEINNLDEVAPSIDSGDTATAIDENSGEDQVVYTATADDSLDISAGVTFSLAGDSDPALSIDSLTGAVTLSTDPDYEAQSQYSFAVIATDAAGNASEAQSVTLDINNLDEIAPIVTSGDTASAIDENSGAGQVVYTATASDTDFNGLEDITFSLADESLGFSIDADTGVVTTNADFAADYENAQSQSFTVVATDATGNTSTQQLVSVAINNLDEIAPSITSGEAAIAVNENSGAGQVVYTATATDYADTSDGFSFSLADDSLGFSIDADTGVVTTNDDFAADYENAQSQNFTVVATDVAGNVSEAQSVILEINDLDDAPPTITSTDNVILIEGTGSNQVVYAATADDSGDDVVDSPITFSLADGSDAALSINASTGEVTLSTDPDHEEQSQYNFAVIATDAAGNASDSQLVTLRVAEVVSGSSASAIESGAIDQRFIQNADGSITLQLFMSAATTANYASGIHSIDLVLQYDSIYVGSIIADQISSPANPFDFSVNDDTENEIAVAQIYFPTVYNPSSEIPIIEVDFNLLEGVSSATFEVSSVIFGEDDVDPSSYEVSVTAYEGTDNSDADVFSLVDGVTDVNSGEGSDIFVVTEDTDANILIDFETGVDTLELGLLLDSAGYTGLSSSSDAADGLAYQLSADTPDIVDLISDADDLLNNAFGGYLDDSTNVLTVFADINSDADSDAIIIKTMQVTLDQDSTIDDEDIVATISAFIA